jgi:hypothetical protein
MVPIIDLQLKPLFLVDKISDQILEGLLYYLVQPLEKRERKSNNSQLISSGLSSLLHLQKPNSDLNPQGLLSETAATNYFSTLI